MLARQNSLTVVEEQREKAAAAKVYSKDDFSMVNRFEICTVRHFNFYLKTSGLLDVFSVVFNIIPSVTEMTHSTLGPVDGKFITIGPQSLNHHAPHCF